MKKNPFDLDLYSTGVYDVVNRKGMKVEVLQIESPLNCNLPIRVLHTNGAHIWHYSNGKPCVNNSEYDLFLVKKEENKNQQAQHIFDVMAILNTEKEMKMHDIERYVERVKEIDATLEEYRFQLSQIFID